MKTKPIIFNRQMVQAILAEHKHVTRRLVKPQPIFNDGFWELGSAGWSYGIESLHPVPGHSLYNRMPCHVGDILWVRETFCWKPGWDCDLRTENFRCSCDRSKSVFHPKKTEHGCWLYKADFKEDEKPSLDIWHPSIHMPFIAARIFLKVTDVRIERIQQMTTDDFIKEGIIRQSDDTDNSIAIRFHALWDTTIPLKDMGQYRFQHNPWVWVIEFEKLSEVKNIEDLKNYMEVQDV